MPRTELYVMAEPAYKNSSWNTRCIAGMKAEAARAGLTMVMADSCEGFLRQHRAHTCVVCCADEHWARQVIRTLDASGVHCVLAGPHPNAFCGVSGTAIDRNQLVQDMVQYFIRNGRRRLACLGMEPWNVNDTIRVAAFHNAMRSAGLSSGDADVFAMTDGMDACVLRLLSQASAYDGVICVNDQVAVRLIVLAAKAGVRVPEDLFVSGSGNLLLGQLCQPTLTTTELDYYQMGRQTVRIWQYADRTPDADAVTVTIGHKLIVRGSTAFLPQTPCCTLAKDATASPPQCPDETSMTLDMLETCLFHCDALDLRLMAGIMRGHSLEAIAGSLFLSMSSINYRIKKIYDVMGVSSRRALQRILLTYLPDADALCRMADERTR